MLSKNVTFRIVTTMLGILEGKIWTAIYTYKREERGLLETC